MVQIVSGSFDMCSDVDDGRSMKSLP